VLHELVAGHAQTWLAELRDADPDVGGLPRYVEREPAAYLRCGILAHGFARVCKPVTTRSWSRSGVSDEAFARAARRGAWQIPPRIWWIVVEPIGLRLPAILGATPPPVCCFAGAVGNRYSWACAAVDRFRCGPRGLP
jgi:hypothetical protein